MCIVRSPFHKTSKTRDLPRRSDGGGGEGRGAAAATSIGSREIYEGLNRSCAASDEVSTIVCAIKLGHSSRPLAVLLRSGSHANGWNSKGSSPGRIRRSGDSRM